MKFFLKLFLFALLGLGVILLINTFRLKSKQIEAVELEEVTIGPDSYKTLSSAIKIPTISKTGYVDTSSFILLDSLIDTTYFMVDSVLKKYTVNTFSSIYHWKGSNSELKPILLLAHKDVVPMEKERIKDWSYDPFSGQIKDGIIYGRGTLHDKSSLFAMLEAVERLLHQGYQPQRSIYFAFGHDKEIGGLNGAVAMSNFLETKGLRFEYILDEGLVVLEDAIDGLNQPVCLIGIAEKGYASFDLHVNLKESGHSFMPPSESAIGKLSTAIAKIQQNPFPAKLNGTPNETFDYLSPEMGFFNKLVMSNRWITSGLIKNQLAQKPSTNALIRTTAVPTLVHAGVKDNVLPSRARATINTRIRPGETIESTLNHLKNAVNDPEVEITLSPGIQATEAPTPSSSASLGFNILQKTAKSIFPKSVVAPSLMVATTDSRYYTALSKQVFRFLPLEITNEDLHSIHGKDEQISLEAYSKMINFYYTLIKNSCD